MKRYKIYYVTDRPFGDFLEFDKVPRKVKKASKLYMKSQRKVKALKGIVVRDDQALTIGVRNR